MPPAHISYRIHLDKNVINKINLIVQESVQENKYVTYIDLFSDMRFTEKDYHDANHLNHSGAKKLSIIVNEYINNL